MTPVSPVVTLTQAIEKLMAMRGASSWSLWFANSHEASLVLAEGQRAVTFDGYHPEDADLIVTLHRTIDAQLELLRCGIFNFEPQYGDDQTREFLAALSLARAILGKETVE